MDLNNLETLPSQVKPNNLMLNSEPSEEYNDLFLNQSLSEGFFSIDINKKYKQTPHQTSSEEDEDGDFNLPQSQDIVDTNRDREEFSFIPISPNPKIQLGQTLIPMGGIFQQRHSRSSSSPNKSHQSPTAAIQSRGMYSSLMQYFLIKTFVRKLSNKRNMNSHFNQYHFNVINDKGSELNLKLFKDNALRLKPILQPQTANHEVVLAQIVMKRISNWVVLIYVKTNLIIDRIPLFYPESMSKLMWDGFVQIARVYFMFVIPMDLSFNQQQFMFGLLYSTTVVMMTLLIMDFLVSFNTAHYMQGHIVINRFEIAKHVVWKSGGLEIASVIFLVMIWCIVEIDQFYQVNAEAQLYQLGLMIFFIQCRNISKFIRQVEEALNFSKSTKAILELIKLIAAVIVVLHIFACLWYWAGYYSHLQYGKSWLDIRDSVGTNWQEDYLYAFYYSTVTMFTVGYGDITPQSDLEVIISICFMMITSIQLSYSVSTVGAIIDKISAYEEEKLKKLQTINTFMQSKKISYELQYQIREYLNYFWQEQNEEDTQQEKTIISQLSENLRLRLMLEANSLILNNCILFRNHFSEQLKTKLVKCIRQVAVQPEDIIDFDNLIPDQQKNQIYLCFIERGSIQILIENDGNSMPNGNHSDVSVVSQLYEGESLGFISFITGKKSPERYRSIGFTKLLLLNREDFLKVFKQLQSQIIPEFPEDNEQYQNFQDQLKFYQRSDFLQIQCFSCRSPDHKAIDCPLLHFIPDREFLIKQVQFSRHQMRNEPTVQVYKRKGKKGTMSARLDQDYIQESAVFFQNDYWQETLFFDCDFGEVSQSSMDETQRQDLQSDDEIKEVLTKKSSYFTRQQTRSIQATINQDDEIVELQNHSADQFMMLKSSMKKTNKTVKFKMHDLSINVVKHMSPLPQFNSPHESDRMKFNSVQNTPISKFALQAKRANTIEVPQEFSPMGFPSTTSISRKEPQSSLKSKFQKVVHIVKSLNSLSRKRPSLKNRQHQDVSFVEQERIQRLTFERSQLINLIQRKKRFTHNPNLTNTSQAFQRDSQCAEFTILKLQMMTEVKAPLSHFENTKSFKFYFPHNNLESVLFKYETYYKPNQQNLKHLPQIFSSLVQYLLYPYEYIDKYKFKSAEDNNQQQPSRLRSMIKNLVLIPQKRQFIKKITKHARLNQTRPLSDGAILIKKPNQSLN